MADPADLLHGFELRRLGDKALLLHGGDRIDAALNRRVHALAQVLRTDAPPWLVDLVPAYASLALHLDADAGGSDTEVLAQAEAWVRQRLATAPSDVPTPTGRDVTIEVRYGGECGPDLETLAAHAGIPATEVIARHIAPVYRVAMLGFAPGFPYLLGLDPLLTMPRRAQPRRSVAAGSVGIGGAQTGIYPRAGAGGWQLIGRTDRVLFDPTREPCSLLQPGDRVRFVALDA